MMSATQVKKNPRIAQTAALYPFFAASHAVITTGMIQITARINSSAAPRFGMSLLSSMSSGASSGPVARGARP